MIYSDLLQEFPRKRQHGEGEKVGVGGLVGGGYASFSCTFKKKTEWGKQTKIY